MELLKLLNASDIVAQIISFLILFFILRAVAWKKILFLLDQRKERIASELKSCEGALAQAERLKDEYEEKLRSIEEFREQKIRQAIEEGKALAEEVAGNARVQAKQILENANKNIEQELLKAKEELKTHIVDLTMSATENIIGQKLTPQDDRKLIEDFLQGLDKT